MAIQVFGGMGYVEESGIAQYLRDARIRPIYEGTTAIQAADLAGRKIARDGGAALAIAEPFLKLFGTALGGWQMGKAAAVAATAIARGSNDPFYRWKIAAAGFYADHLLPKTAGLLLTVEADHQRLLALPDEAF